MPANTSNLLPDLIAFLLTLAVFSYLLGDNPFYRLAVHIFVGAAAGYAALVAWYNVLGPQLVTPLLAFNLTALIGGVLALLFCLKAFPRLGGLGSLPVAFLVGVGSAVAIGGAVTGTLFPQTAATFLSLLPVNEFGGIEFEKSLEAVVIVIGTLATLGFFYYGARPRPGQAPERPLFIRPLARVGQVFIGLTFGVMYAGAVAASLAVFAERAGALGAMVARFMP